MFLFQARISHVLCFISICDLFTDSPPYTEEKVGYSVENF
jgi:hypothetical protein